VDEQEYKYFDLPSLGSGYGKYEWERESEGGGERDRQRVCVFVCAQNVQLNAQAAYRIHKAPQTVYFNILYYITEHSTC
jgi:hypothetical protein